MRGLPIEIDPGLPALLGPGLLQGSAADANATLTLTKQLFLKMMTGGVKLKDLLPGDELKASGSRVGLVRCFSLFAKATGTFPIVTP